MIKIPPYLKKGDTVAIVCPAGFLSHEKAQTCINTLVAWGFQVKLGKTLGGVQQNYFSGSDAERLADLQAMMDDPTVKAILCGRGGYGVSRIIDGLDFKQFKKHPKWIIGFSDITVLHAHLNSVIKTASIHAPMAGAFNDGGAENEWVQSLRKAIKGQLTNYSCLANPLNKLGKAYGDIIGGNLSLLVHLIGTASSIKTKGKILFIEDIGEHVYQVDRMMVQLKRAGLLKDLAGLIIGGFTDMEDTTVPFGKSVQECIAEHLEEYDYPVCFDFPVSHAKENYAIKIGLPHQLLVGKNKTSLKELA
ncbi:MAG: LD-carboxypeptidase [Chitinophagaceae bacterium BSSC1]|nr:MAG: LD-carboxypeptidase [Chitinophagaceae bacterium BSSC1]